MRLRRKFIWGILAIVLLAQLSIAASTSIGVNTTAKTIHPSDLYSATASGKGTQDIPNATSMPIAKSKMHDSDNISIRKILSTSAPTTQGIRIVFNNSEFYFNASNGGEITEYYDLLTDPARSRNLANITIPGSLDGNLFPLFASVIYNPYIVSDYSTGGDPNASVDLVGQTNDSIVIYTTSRMMNRVGSIVTNTQGSPVYINTTWTFDNISGDIFVERTFSIPTSYNLPSGWRWYSFYFTRTEGFSYNGTFYFFNTTHTEKVISNATSYVNNYTLFPQFPDDNKSIFGVAMPFSNTSIEGDGTNNVIITYYYDNYLKVSEWKSDTSNLRAFNITEAGAVHEFSEPYNFITYTYRAVVNFTHQPINETNVVRYAKYVDSIYPLIQLNLTTDKEVYNLSDPYTISLSGTSQYNLTNLTLKLVATNNSGIYFENEYGSQNYTKGETFSMVMFQGYIPNQYSGNLTFTAELVSQTGAIEASDTKTVIVLQPQFNGIISGCTIVNSPGAYVLNQSITNSLANYCINVTSSDVVLDGAGYTINGVNALSTSNGIYVYNSTTSLTNVTVKNLTVKNWGNGISYKNAANGRIENNALSSSSTAGILLYSSSSNVLNGNTATNNQYGIDLSSNSNNNNISGNTVTSNSITGIILDSSSNNVLNGNTATTNQYGIDLSSNSNNNNISGNTVTSNSVTGIILDSSSSNVLNGNTATNSQYGIDLSHYSNNNILSGNTASSNSVGIILDSSSNNMLNSNTASNNMISNRNYGFDISYSNNNTLSGNTASSNSIGILLYSSSNNMLNGNTASSNSQYGIDLSNSSNNNIIYNNFFSNNNNFVISNSISTWDITKTSSKNIVSGPYLGGNFWANPSGTGFSQTCADGDGDGICDSAYTLDSNDIDYFPLTYSPVTAGTDTIGVYRSGMFFLKNSNNAGNADITFGYGLPGDTPVTGDWNADGITTVGVYRSGMFLLRNSNTAGNADVTFGYGLPGDTPVTGDWNGDHITKVGVYRSGVFFLRDETGATTTIGYGLPGDTPVTGDWNGDHITKVGVYRSGVFFLRDESGNTTTIGYGLPGDTPVTGDWNGDHITKVGVYRNGVFYLRDETGATTTFGYGLPRDIPVVGYW